MNATWLVRSRTTWFAASAIAALSCMPADAAADNFAFGLGLGLQRASVWVPPVYETRSRTVTIPAVYESRVRKVWHEPVYEERRVAVQIPADVIDRHIRKYDRWGNLIGVRRVQQVVRPARTEWRVERVLVCAGRFDTVVERVLVRPENTRVVYENVLVSPGHWAPPDRGWIGSDFALTVGFRN